MFIYSLPCTQIPGAKDATVEYGSGFYLFPCATQLQVSLSLGGQAFALHPDDFNLGRLNAQSEYVSSLHSFVHHFAVCTEIVC